MLKGSDLLVAALENEGVDRIFGIPGEENLDLVESLRKSSINLILTRHEQAAAFMAATHGRLTGKPGVCLTTLGPGALNLTTGAAYARGDAAGWHASRANCRDGLWMRRRGQRPRPTSVLLRRYSASPAADALSGVQRGSPDD